MKIKIDGGIYFDTNALKYGCGTKHKFFNGEFKAWANYVPICAHTVEADIPDDFDPRPGMIEVLQEERKRAHANFAAKVMEIDQCINSLLAIENAP